MSQPDITARFVTLARTPQLGWAQLGIGAPETVYEHSLDMARIARPLALQHYPHLDAGHIAEMCMVHGLSELRWAGQTRVRRTRADKLESMAQLVATTAPSRELTRVAALFAEYHENRTPAARLANQLDSVQIARQCLRYEQANPQLNLLFLWLMAEQRLQDAPLKNAFAALAGQRPSGVDERPHPMPQPLSPEEVQAFTAQTLARIGTPDAVRAERAAAFAGPVYRF